MGTGASTQGTTSADAPAAAADLPGIMIISAESLRNRDTKLSGKSDPYAICRVGLVGSTWEEKGQHPEHRTETIKDSLDPVWNYAFPFQVPDDYDHATGSEECELHIKVFDSDFLLGDDFLGEVRVPLSSLAAEFGKPMAFELDYGGKVKILMDKALELVLADAVQEQAKSCAVACWHAEPQRHLQKLGQFFHGSLTLTSYYAAMVGMWRASFADMKGDEHPSFKYFQQRSWSKDRNEDSGVWHGPGCGHVVTLSGHNEVEERLRGLGPRLGTTDTDGEAYKGNYLAFQLLSRQLWPEVSWREIGLAAPQSIHAVCRPLLFKLCGPGGNWSLRWLMDEARQFFHGRHAIKVSEDLRIWVARILHQIFLGLVLTEEEAAQFVAFQQQMLLLSHCPDAALRNGTIASKFDLAGCLHKKANWLERYKPLLLQRLPEAAQLSADLLVALNSAVMDALLFAGGASVPTILQFAVALPFSTWGREHLPEDFRVEDTARLPSYLWEVCRVFPPVTGFCYTERNGAGDGHERNVFLNLQMAQCDAKVWGEDAGRFKLRPVCEYQQKSVGFAESARAPKSSSPNARSCPAKDLGLAMALAFMTEFGRTMDHLQNTVWKPYCLEEQSDGRCVELSPDQITISAFSTSSFILRRHLSMPQEKPTGLACMEELSVQEQAELADQVKCNNKFDHVNYHTKIFYKVMKLLGSAQPSDGPLAVKLPIPLPEGIFGEDVIWEGAFGMRMVIFPEEQKLGRLGNILQNAVMGLMANAKHLGEMDESANLMWFDSDAEAHACMNVTFGRYLPAQFNSWPDLGTDAGTAALCVTGVAAWYLQPARSEADSGHPVPIEAAFECSLEHMSKYGTRNPWCRYGQTAYLAAPRDPDRSAMPEELVGIWSCSHGRLICPGDDVWEHAKAGFRSSVCTNVTLKDHLAIIHWVVANGLQSATRESLGVDHCVRRLLRQFSYGTAEINNSSREFLLPLDRLGYRTFGFNEFGWGGYFTDIFEEWHWKAFPERLREKNLPGAFTGTWPLMQDGLLVWGCFEKYVRSYLNIFYGSEEELLNDTELVAFWKYFDTYIKWHLPPMTREGLVSLLADLMFWVTAGHEYQGAIAEYLSILSGLSSKLIDGKAVPDVQSFAQALAIISLTGLRQPQLMDDWGHLFQAESWGLERQQAALEVVRQFQVDLGDCAEEVEHRNEERERRGERKFVAFNPRILETAVSI